MKLILLMLKLFHPNGQNGECKYKCSFRPNGRRAELKKGCIKLMVASKWTHPKIISVIGQRILVNK